MPKTMFDKIWEAHEVRRAGLLYIDLHLVHEVTSPQAFEGLRLAGRAGAPARPDARHRRPQRPHRRDRGRAADRRRALAQAGRDAGAQLRGVRHPALLAGLRPPGDRARDRARARPHPAGDDDRLRRQPHLHPRRLRRARLRHRHLRGRARAGDAVPAPEAPEDDADHLLGRARRRRHRQGPDPGDDRPDRHRRDDGPRGRVRRRGDRGALDGGPDDDLQHVDRGRRPRRHDRSRRDHVRVRPRAARAPPSDFEAAVDRWRALPTDAGASFDTEVEVDAAALSPQVTWGTNPGDGRRGHRPRARPGELDRRPTARRPSARSPTWRSSPARRSRRSPLDRVFIGSCTNSRIEDLRAAAAVVDGPQGAPTRCARWSCPAPQQVKAAGRGGGLDDVFQAAGFDWREAGCSMCLGMNPDILQPRRALRLDLEPQLRGPPGQGRAHPPGQPADGRGGRDRGPLRRHPETGADSMRPIDVDRGQGVGARPGQRRHRPDHPQAVPEADRAHRLRRVPLLRLALRDWRRSSSEPNPILRHRSATSAAAPPASTPPGRWRTTASRRSSPRRSPTSSTTTA